MAVVDWLVNRSNLSALELLDTGIEPFPAAHNHR
jgi:hypothetical protein